MSMNTDAFVEHRTAYETHRQNAIDALAASDSATAQAEAWLANAAATMANAIANGH